MGLGERKRRILKAIIDEYIENAEPVGSKSISMRKDMNLSSATIRNEMADLEDLGYLEQPHISSGRIPSQTGYRLYVNELMNRYRLSLEEIQAINSTLKQQMRELEMLLHDAGRVIAELTNYTSYAAMPSMSKMSIKKFDLIFVDEHTVIIVLVTNTALVKNKYLKTKAPLEESRLVGVTIILNNRFSNLTIDRITLFDIERAKAEVGDLDFIVSETLGFVADVLGEEGLGDVYVGGVSRLLSHPEYRDPVKARQIMDFLADERSFKPVKLLKLDKDKGKLHIAIGTENQAEPLMNTSIVYGTYGVNESFNGIIGVVGPIRMDYAKVAANLNYFIEGLNKLLSEIYLNDSNEK